MVVTSKCFIDYSVQLLKCIVDQVTEKAVCSYSKMLSVAKYELSF